MTNFEIVYAKYITSLVDNSTTDEIRNAVLEPSIAYGKDDTFSQVLVCFMQLMRLQKLDVDTVMERIENEYNALNMQDIMGEYSQYKEFFRICVTEMKNGDSCLDSAYDLTENIDNSCDAIKYGVSTAVLRYLVFAKKIIEEMELTNKMLALVDTYSQEPEGYLSVRSICEVVINNTNSID